MKDKFLIVILSISALMLASSFFFYLVIYSPRKAEEKKQELLLKEKENKKEEATRYCLSKYDKKQKEMLDIISKMIKGCPYTGICNTQQAITFSYDGVYDESNDPTTAAFKTKFMTNCINTYPIK
ncbi:MAG TPA: hypothetical protein PLX95_03905 [bacterium]|nr:hypothetical protein [bacterium]